MAASADARVGDTAMTVATVRSPSKPPGVPTPWLGCGASSEGEGEGRLTPTVPAPQRPPIPTPTPVAEPGRSNPGLGKAAIQRPGVAGPMANGDCNMTDVTAAADEPELLMQSTSAYSHRAVQPEERQLQRETP